MKIAGIHALFKVTAIQKNVAAQCYQAVPFRIALRQMDSRYSLSLSQEHRKCYDHKASEECSLSIAEVSRAKSQDIERGINSEKESEVLR